MKKGWPVELGTVIRKLRWVYQAVENVYVTNGSMENARAAVAENRHNRAIRESAALVPPLERSA